MPEQKNKTGELFDRALAQDRLQQVALERLKTPAVLMAFEGMGISDSQIARTLRVSTSTVHGWKKCRHPIPKMQLARLTLLLEKQLAFSRDVALEVWAEDLSSPEAGTVLDFLDASASVVKEARQDPTLQADLQEAEQGFLAPLNTQKFKKAKTVLEQQTRESIQLTIGKPRKSH
jgi:DNA-binding transcriptional regulator YiaG